MKKIGVILPCLCLALMSFTAKADTLKYDGPNPPGNIGPYNMTLNPGTAGAMNLNLFCVNDNLTITVGESWPVGVVTGNNLGTNSLTDSDPTIWEEAAFILSEDGKTYLDGTTLYTFLNTEVQEALWNLFNPGTATSDPAATELLTLATTSSSPYDSFISSDGYGNYLFYIYDGPCLGTNCSGDPQNFIGDPLPTSPIPEPSALLLLGTGLTGLAGVARRKLVRR